MSQINDLVTVYDFIKSTGENNIRKMMAGPKMTAAHIGLLFKIIRCSKVEEFVQYYDNNSFPRAKYSNGEDAVKEGFWAIAFASFVQLGLVDAKKTPAPGKGTAAVAAAVAKAA